MFPNVRLMAASTLVSVMALFFAFGVYASLRVSHEPLARSSRAAPLQLVGFNVAMLPVAVLEPFANQQAAPTATDSGPAMAYSAAQAIAPPAQPIAGAPDTRVDNAAIDEPAENTDVTQMQIAESVEAAAEAKSPDARAQERVAPAENLPERTADAAPSKAALSTAAVPTAALPTAALPTAASPAAPAPPQISPVEHTATIEPTSAAAAEPAAADDDAVDIEIAPKKKKKKRVVQRHLNRAPLRATAQTSTPQQQSLSWPAGIGGPLVTAPKR